MYKSEHGKCDYCLDRNTGIGVCRWHDNNLVFIPTNFLPLMHYISVKRFPQEEKQNFYHSNIAGVYFMGGVDRGEREFISSVYKGKIWYFPLLAHYVNMVIQNDCKVYGIRNEKLDKNEFGRSSATHFLDISKIVT